MDIFDVDKNFIKEDIDLDDKEFFSVLDMPDCLYGVFFDYDDKMFRRIPKKVAEKTSEGVAYVAKNTAGGRIKIKTDSPYLCLKVIEPFEKLLSSMPSQSQFGFSIEEKDVFHGVISPNIYKEFVVNRKNHFEFEDIVFFSPEKKIRDLTIYFPLYNTVNSVLIGVQKGSILKGSEYGDKKPIVFYGSSITQGAASGRAGSDYVSVLCKRLDSDYINLGFSGSCLAEDEIVDYIGSIDARAFVLGYDHNSSYEENKNNQYKLYERIREKNKKTPIIVFTRPNTERNFFEYKGKKIEFSEDKYVDTISYKRNKIALGTYKTARKNGDKNIYFINGNELFGKEDRVLCTADCCHPTDLGFYKMANRIYPVLKKALKKSKID